MSIATARIYGTISPPLSGMWLVKVGSYFITDTVFWLQTWSTVAATTDLLCSRWRSLVECRSRAVVCPTSAWRDVSRPRWQRVNWQVQALHNHTHTQGQSHIHSSTQCIRGHTLIIQLKISITNSHYTTLNASTDHFHCKHFVHNNNNNNNK